MNDDKTVETSEDQQELSTSPKNRQSFFKKLYGDPQKLEGETSEDQQELPADKLTRVLSSQKRPDGAPQRPDVIYRIIGIITIIFGIIVGIVMLVTFANQPQSFLSSSKAPLTFGSFVIAVGAAMAFIVPGVICIGISQIIKLLDK